MCVWTATSMYHFYFLIVYPSSIYLPSSSAYTFICVYPSHFKLLGHFVFLLLKTDPTASSTFIRWCLYEKTTKHITTAHCVAYHLRLKQALGQAIQVYFLVQLSFSHGDGNIVCGPYCSASSLSGTGPWGNSWQSVKPFGHFTGGRLSPHWWHTFTSALSNMSEEEEGLSILAKNVLELSPSLFLPQLLSRAWLSARAFKH